MVDVEDTVRARLPGELATERGLVDGDHIRGVISRNSWIPMCPRPPTPITAAVCPGCSTAAALRTAR